MTPNTIIKQDYSDAVAQWVNSGNTVKVVSGFEKPQYKKPCEHRIKRRPKDKLLDDKQLRTLNKFLHGDRERLEKLAIFLGISVFALLQIQTQQQVCSNQRWSAILKFIEGYGA